MIQEYIEYIHAVKGYSAHTAKAYKGDLIQFTKYARTYNPAITWSTIPPSILENWIKEMQQMNYDTMSIRRKVAAVKGIYKYFYTKGMIKLNWMRYVSKPKAPERIPGNIYTKEEIRDLIEDLKMKKQYEKAFIIALFFYTGARISEVLNLRYEDVNFERMSLKLDGKGKRQREVPISEEIAELMRIYVENSQDIIENDKIIKISERELRDTVEITLRKIAGKRATNPHSLRHSFASALIDENEDLETIREMMGHKNIETTTIYTHISTRKKHRALQKIA